MNETDDEKCKNGYEQKSQANSIPNESLPGRCYEICVAGRLDNSWSEWFEGLEMQPWGENWTVLWGQVVDQAALLGILNKLCRLNLPLVSVNEIRRRRQADGSEQKGGE